MAFADKVLCSGYITNFDVKNELFNGYYLNLSERIRTFVGYIGTYLKTQFMKIELVRVDDAFHFEGSGSSEVKIHVDGSPEIGGHNAGSVRWNYC